VPHVEGRDVVAALLEDGLDEELDPFRRDAPQVGIDDGAGLDLERAGDLEDRPEGAALAGDAVVGGDELVEAARPPVEEDGVEIDAGLANDVRGAVSPAWTARTTWPIVPALL
jgi:hypothetical protein